MSTTSSGRRSNTSTTARSGSPPGCPVEDLGEIFDVELPTDEVETVGGLLAQALGRVPIPGAQATFAGLRLIAEGTTGRRNRIDSVLVRRVPDDEPSEDDSPTSETLTGTTVSASDDDRATDKERQVADV